tara:strand:- start:641 stop:1201 length:561 start_codon:yes stop_codon:yes gene_type:complete
MNKFFKSCFFFSAYICSTKVYAESGMPQLDPSSYVSQTFWLIITFVLLFSIINFYYIPKIEKIKILRESKVEDFISNAETFNVEAENLKLKIENELESTKIEIDKKISELIKKNNTLVEKKIREVDFNLEKKISLLEEQLKEKRNQFLKDIPKYSFEISNLIYYKIINEKNEISNNDFKKLMVDEK